MKAKRTLLMNENFLDHPLCLDTNLYSIVVREPVERAISHVNHFLDAVAARGHEHFGDTKGWRLNIIQANYMTWSLTAGLDTTEDARWFRPTQEYLEEAIEIVSQFDFVIDLSSSACTKRILEWMHINPATLSEIRNSYGSDYKTDYQTTSYNVMNELDTQLYQRLRQIEQVDCDFYEYVHEYERRRP